MGDRIKGKVAIVTGAGSIRPGIGNGKASAIVYAREGAKVMAVDVNLDAAEQTKRMIDEEGGECITFQADVSKSSDCKSMSSPIRSAVTFLLREGTIGIPVIVKKEQIEL